MAERKGASYTIKAKRSGGDPNAHAQTTNASAWAAQQGDRAVWSIVGRGGTVYDTGAGGRPAFSFMEGAGGNNRAVTGGPAGSVRRRGPRFSGAD